MPTPTEELIARICLNAASLRDDSYDRHQLAIDQANPDNYIPIGIGSEDKMFKLDYNKYYALTLAESCDKAALNAGQPLLGMLVYLALDGWWNDTLAWAQNIVPDDPNVAYFKQPKEAAAVATPNPAE